MAPPTESQLSEQMHAGRGLVLYVEDNLDNLKRVEAIMERLTDMPGSEVLRRLKAEPTTENTPVIILRANALPAQIAELLAVGARASPSVTKPIDIQEFLNVVPESLAEAVDSGRKPKSKALPPEE